MLWALKEAVLELMSEVIVVPVEDRLVILQGHLSRIRERANNVTRMSFLQLTAPLFLVFVGGYYCT